MGKETTEGGNEGGQTPPAGDGFTPITSQEEFNQRLAERLERERSKYSDYDDLKAKAARLDQIEESTKSEQQKLEDRIAAAERAAEQSRIEALKFKVASKFGVSDEDAELFLTGSDEKTLTKQAERLSERDDQKKKSGNHVPKEGTGTPPAKPDEMREFTRNLFGGGD